MAFRYSWIQEISYCPEVLVSTLALFSVSVPHTRHGHKSGPSGSHQLSAKGCRAPAEVLGLALLGWEGLSHMVILQPATGQEDHIRESQPTHTSKSGSWVALVLQGKLGHVPSGKHRSSWGPSLHCRGSPFLSSVQREAVFLSPSQPSVWDRLYCLNVNRFLARH